MKHKKLDEWPCYCNGHDFDLVEFNIAFQSALLGKNTELKCSRCGRRVSNKEIENPIMQVAVAQNKIFQSVVCPNIAD